MLVCFTICFAKQYTKKYLKKVNYPTILKQRTLSKTYILVVKDENPDGCMNIASQTDLFFSYQNFSTLHTHLCEAASFLLKENKTKEAHDP